MRVRASAKKPGSDVQLTGRPSRASRSGFLVLAILWSCTTTAGLEEPVPAPVTLSKLSPNARIDFETAAAALDSEDRHLATDLLRALRDGSEGLERRYYEALLLTSAARPAEARTEMEAIASESAEDSLPDWLWSDLVRRLAEHRLTALQVEDERKLEAVLARHYEARGGVERLRSLSAMVALGTVQSDNGQLRFRIVRKRPRFYRLDLYSANGHRIDAAGDQIAWRLVAPFRPEDGTVLEGEERQSLLDNSHFDDVLLRYRETGEHLYLAGTELVGGRKVYRIEVDSQSGYRLTIFLDHGSGLEVRRLLWGEPDGPPTVINVEQGDFDGRALPVRQIVESANGGIEYIFDSYDFDSQIDPAAFDLETVRKRGAARLAAEAKESAARNSRE